MNRFETAEKVMNEMGLTTSYAERNPYAVGLRSVLAAAITGDDAEPRVVDVGYHRPNEEDGQNATLLVKATGESWIVYDEIDDRESLAIPAVWLVRPHADGELRFVGGLKPTTTFTHPDGSRVTFQWKNIAAFEDDEEGIREVFRSWVRGD